MKQIEELATQKPDPELIAFARQANADALAFEASLREGGRWKQGAEEIMLQKLDDVAHKLPAVRLEDAFTYKSIVGVMVNYLAQGRPDLSVVSGFLDHIALHCLTAQKYIWEKQRNNLLADEEARTNEFQQILRDGLLMFSKAASVTTNRLGIEDFDKLRKDGLDLPLF